VRRALSWTGALVATLWVAGCSLTPPPHLSYYIEATPVLPEGEEYYIDPVDSSVVWSRAGVEVKVQLLTDEDLDAEYEPDVSPFTLGDVRVPYGRYPAHPSTDPGLYGSYTPPLFTVFEITVINRTRERVEFDPTQVALRLDDGRFFYCSQGIGLWDGYPHTYDYAYLKFSDSPADMPDLTGNVQRYVLGLGERDGRSQFRARDARRIWNQTTLQREKPVRKGERYSGKITFPPLPLDADSFVLQVRDFILAFDGYEPGKGNPVETTDMAFRFEVDHGIARVERRP